MPKSVFTESYRQFLVMLIAARTTKNLSQQVLAHRLGKPQSFVSKYESGERRLDVIEFLNVTTAIGVDPLPIIRKLVSVSSST